jgi:hypothetical protein
MDWARMRLGGFGFSITCSGSAEQIAADTERFRLSLRIETVVVGAGPGGVVGWGKL